jgi:hypothetical protein
MHVIGIDNGEPDLEHEIFILNATGFENESTVISKKLKQHLKRTGHGSARVLFVGKDESGAISAPPPQYDELIPYLASLCILETREKEIVYKPKPEEAADYYLPQLIYELSARVRTALQYYLMYQATRFKDQCRYNIAANILNHGWTKGYNFDVTVIHYLKLPNGEPGEVLKKETRAAYADGKEGFRFHETFQPRKNEVVQVNWPTGKVFFPAQRPEIIKRVLDSKKN